MPHAIVVYLCLFSCVFLQPLSAEDTLCTVTQDGRRTLYSVPEFEADNCHYYWTNITHSVLANHVGKIDEMVVTKSNRTLLTYECSELIYYIRDCISEGTQRMATCTSNCTGNAGFPEDTGIPSYVTAVIVVVVIAVVILVLLGLCKLCSKRGSICSCNQTRCIYTPAKVPSHPPNTTDVEAVG